MMNFTLSNQVQIPAVGIGTFMMTPDQAEQAVVDALACGYRMIDTAQAYNVTFCLERYRPARCGGAVLDFALGSGSSQSRTSGLAAFPAFSGTKAGTALCDR